MPGETKQTAEIANLVSSEIFEHFGWKRAGTSDHNFWGQPPPKSTKPAPGKKTTSGIGSENEEIDDLEDEVAQDEATNPNEKKEYPADVVFWYDDPYFHKRTFIHFDLKSYGANSISHKQVVKALRRLSSVIAIADTSEDWGSKFAPNQSNLDINGALFVHNHDNKAGTKFTEFFQKIGPLTVTIPERKCVYVFGPERISYLLSVVNDMQRLKGDGILPRSDEGEISFFYPYGKMKPQSNLLSHATAEVLLGPMLVIRHRYSNSGKQSGYIIYYDGPGSDEEEFLFILETIFKKRLLTDTDSVRIRLANPSQNATLVFRKAKDSFVEFYHDLDIFRKQVDRIEYSSVVNVIKQFSTVELGLE